MRFALPAILVVFVSGVALAACGKSGSSGDASGSGGSTPVIDCDPGENIFCRCPGGEAGTKTCKSDGHSFEACVTRTGVCPEIPDTTASSVVSSSSSASGTGGAGGGGGTPGALFDACGT